MSSIEETASALLATMRATPMRRGEVARAYAPLQGRVVQTLEQAGLPLAAAWRVSRQLIFKCDIALLEAPAICADLARRLVGEWRDLQTKHGLSPRQAAEILPKLSSAEVDAFVVDLQVADRTIARTIFNAAVEAADPRATGLRYLRAYQQVASQMDQLDPSVARTLANATFTARVPRRKALEHFARFAEVLRHFEEDPGLLRRVARAAFRTPDPVAAAERIVRDYRETVAKLTATGIAPQIAKTVAQSSHFRAHQDSTHREA